MTCWVRGTHLSTVERERARAWRRAHPFTVVAPLLAKHCVSPSITFRKNLIITLVKEGKSRSALERGRNNLKGVNDFPFNHETARSGIRTWLCTLARNRSTAGIPDRETVRWWGVPNRRTTTQGPSWGYLVNSSETLSIFGDKCL